MKTLYKFIFGVALILGIGCNNRTSVRLNHIQILGSHNSYKQPIQEELLQLIFEQDSVRALELDYGHPTLTQQLDMGLRGLELDVFYDPRGGRYMDPMGQLLIRKQGSEPKPFDVENKLALPGLKVFHLQDLDFRSHHLLFRDVLRELRKWSEEHPEHLPIILTINAKDQVLDIPGFTKPLMFDADALTTIDREILSIFDPEQLITPDFVRHRSYTLEQSILDYGWPSLETAKGKFLFVLDETGEKRAAYSKGHPSLKDKVMFTTSEPGSPEAAFMVINNPLEDGDKIQEMVRLGYMVRTRADAGTWEARKGDYSRWEAALASGAQLISTDYYLPNPKFNTSYQMRFEDNKIYLVNPLIGVNK